MTRRRFELTDAEWAFIEPLLPNKPRGVPRVDDRQTINGILWRFVRIRPRPQAPSDWATVSG
jgi:transposase